MKKQNHFRHPDFLLSLPSEKGLLEIIRIFECYNYSEEHISSLSGKWKPSSEEEGVICGNEAKPKAHALHHHARYF